MTFAEFYAGVKAIAGEDYFSIQVEATPTEIMWAAYTARAGWTSKFDDTHPVSGVDPHQVLTAILAMHSRATTKAPDPTSDPAGLETVGEVAF